MARFRKLGIRTAAFTCIGTLLICSFYGILSTPGRPRVHTFVARHGTLNVRINPDRTFDLIDYGYFNSFKEPSKNIQFNLKPWCTRTYGILRCNQLILTKATTRSMQAATAICTAFAVKSFSMPWFEKIEKKLDWRHYFELKKALADNHVEIIRPTKILPKTKN